MGEKLDLAGVLAAYWAALTSTIALVAILPALYSIRARLDPFGGARGRQHLGIWTNSKRHWALIRPPPEGPVLEADLHTCLGCETIYLSGYPLPGTGIPSWISLLRKFHASKLNNTRPIHFGAISRHFGRLEKGLAWNVNESRNVRDEISNLVSSGKSHPSEEYWKKELKKQTLIMYNGIASTTIDPTTLIIFILLSQMAMEYRHDGPMGLSITFVGYTGKLRIKSGMETIVEYEEFRDIQKGHNPYPISFPRKPRDCVHMALGIVDRNPEDKVAFDERQLSDGRRYTLTLQKKGYHAQDYANDVYDLMGGRSSDVDFLPFEPADGHHARVTSGLHRFVIKSEDNFRVEVHLDQHISAIIADCLDKLPWSVLGWSIHRGMKDVLLGFALPSLELYRRELAAVFRLAATTYADKLIEQEWKEGFVRTRVPDIVEAAFDGRSKSGNVCRVIAALAEQIHEHGLPTTTVPQQAADPITKPTNFWKNQLINPPPNSSSVAPKKKSLDPDAVTALTKVFFLKCSHEFDYRVYHKLPQKMIMI